MHLDLAHVDEPLDQATQAELVGVPRDSAVRDWLVHCRPLSAGLSILTMNNKSGNGADEAKGSWGELFRGGTRALLAR